MKKKLLLLPLIAAIVYTMLCSYSEGAAVTGGVDGTGATTSTGCSCHTHATSTTVNIELDSAGVSVSHYIAGGAYTIKITGKNTSTDTLPRFGFQVAIVKTTGAGTSSATDAGTLASTGLPTHCRFTSASASGLNINIVEQDSAIVATSGIGDAGTTYVMSIGWAAPAASGTGSIKIYSAINAVNYNGTDLGDKWNNNNVTITELVPVIPITGVQTVCASATTTLSDTYVGGSWSSSNATVATVNTSGKVRGINSGTTIISYSEGTAGIATVTVTVTAPPFVGTISGAGSVCAGTHITLSEGSTSGVWTSSATGIATVSTGGVVTGIAGGEANISYTVTNVCGTATADLPVTVIALPEAGSITGVSRICSTMPVTFTDTMPGGIWSNVTGNATVNTSGVITGVSAGKDTVLYTITNSCGTAVAKKPVVISFPTYASGISGPLALCTGTTIMLTDTATAGAWSSSNTSIASVTPSGVVTGISAGTDTVIYTIANACDTDAALLSIAINLSPFAGIISGVTGVCQGSSIVLTDTASGGSWSCTNGNAIVTTGGLVSGIVAGTDTVEYSVTNACGTVTADEVVIINNAPVAGMITGPSTVCQSAVITDTDIANGGVWSSNDTAIAIVNDSGVISGISGGPVIIHYTVSNACGMADTLTNVIVNPLPEAGMIAGLSMLCTDASVMLSDTIGGGAWSSLNALATVDTDGLVKSISRGVDTIIYKVINSCGADSAVRVITIDSIIFAGIIKGDTTVCTGNTTLLTDSVAGGVWSSDNDGVASVLEGNVTGNKSGSDTIIYSTANICGIDTSFFILNVLPDSVCSSDEVSNLAAAVNPFKVYPNPSTAVFIVQIPITGNTAGIDIIDLTGRVILTTTTERVQTRIDLGNIPAGNYVLKVNAGNKTFREKITTTR